MGFWSRIGRSGKAAVLLAAGVAGGAAAVAVASVPDSNGVIHACYAVQANGEPAITQSTTSTTPMFRIIDPGGGAGQTCSTSAAGAPAPEKEIDWNQSGPAGPTGPQGPAGQNGQNGQNGQTGPPGQTGPAVTIAGGHTFTFAGGQVITVGNGNGTTIETPTPTGQTAGDVVFDNGLSFNYESFNLLGLSGSGGGGGAGKGASHASVHEITITKSFDKSSPKLASYCANGQHFKQVTIYLRKAGKTYATFTLSTVAISSYSVGGGGGAGKGKVGATDSMSLNFTKIEIKYTAQK